MTQTPSEKVLAYRLKNIEVWKVHSERFVDKDDRPDWATKNGFVDVGVHTMPVSNAVVEINYTASRDLLAVHIQVVAHFEMGLSVPSVDDDADQDVVPFKSQEELTTFLVEHGEESAEKMMNQAVLDCAPFIRETVYSASGRLIPEEPIFLAGGPARISLRPQ